MSLGACTSSRGSKDDRAKLLILSAMKAPKVIHDGVPYPSGKARLYDANGTEFVNLVECATRPDPLKPGWSMVFVTMRLAPGESRLLDAVPPSLEDRLRALAAKWHKVERFEAGDDRGIAAKKVRMDCADELEALLLTQPASGV